MFFSKLPKSTINILAISLILEEETLFVWAVIRASLVVALIERPDGLY